MNKGELIERLARKTGLSKKDSKAALDSVFDVITESLTRNEEVRITGFGTFAPRPRRRSNRVNPRTRQRITVPSRVVPGFKAGKSLREKVARSLQAVESAKGMEVRRR